MEKTAKKWLWMAIDDLLLPLLQRDLARVLLAQPMLRKDQWPEPAACRHAN